MDGDLFGPASEHDPGGKVRLRLRADVLSTAIFSPDRVYRYLLDRRWNGATADAPYVLWIMLNPSTADERVNDPTVGRVMTFTAAFGPKDQRYRRAIVANLFAFRATKPGALLAVTDPVGPDNDKHIQRAATDPLCGMVLFAWGDSGPKRLIRPRAAEVRMMTGGLPFCLGTTASGAPRHPLYVPGNTAPTFWSPP